MELQQLVSGMELAEPGVELETTLGTLDSSVIETCPATVHTEPFDSLYLLEWVGGLQKLVVGKTWLGELVELVIVSWQLAFERVALVLGQFGFALGVEHC